MLDEPRYLRALGNTLLLGALVTGCASVLGVSLAYVTARFDFPGKALVAVLPVCTLVVPEVIVSQTWLMILGNNGLLTRALEEHLGLALPSFYGWPGLVLVMSLVYYTYIYLGTLAAIRGFDAQLEEAAQSLGVPPARAAASDAAGGAARRAGLRAAGVHPGGGQPPSPPCWAARCSCSRCSPT